LPPWQIVPAIVSARNSILYGVAGLSAADVWAVGADVASSGRLEETLIMHYDGATWHRVSSPNVGTDTRLFAVATVSQGDVWAVGDVAISGRTQPLIEHFDGTSWQAIALPALSGGDGATLRGLVALSSHDIWAVGSYSHAASPLIEHFDGAQWRVVAAPGVSGALMAVSAVAANNVWAVGSVTGQSARPVVVHWNGRRWQTATLPALGQAGTLVAVAARTANDVWAGGGFDDATGAGWALALHYNGHVWTQVASPLGADIRTLGAVSAHDVWGLGANGVVEHWDGYHWQLLLNATASIPGASGPHLQAHVRPSQSTAAGPATGSTTFGGRALSLSGGHSRSMSRMDSGQAAPPVLQVSHVVNMAASAPRGGGAPQSGTPTETPTDTATNTPTVTPTETPTAMATDIPVDTPTSAPVSTTLTQCPPIGNDTGCGVLITINPDRTTSITDSGQGPYDGSDDTLVGVQNNTNSFIAQISLSSGQGIFDFEGDGICTQAGAPSGCPFGPTGYEGPGVSFSSTASTDGVVVFNNGLAPGASAYFGLEDALSAADVAATTGPTSMPTAISTDTALPSATDTTQPSATDTTQPSATDTIQPSATDTTQPGATNTTQPSATDTTQPGATDTTQPSATPTTPVASHGAPAPAYPNAILALAVLSSHDLWAVGSHDQGAVTRDGDQRPLIEHFTGASWCGDASPAVSTVTTGVFPQALTLDPLSDQAFVLNGDRTLGVIDARTQKLRHTITLGDTVGGALISDPSSGHLFVTEFGTGASTGGVSVLAASTGRLLGRIRSGQHPLAVAISPSIHHAFVVNLQGSGSGSRGSVTMLDTQRGVSLRTSSVGSFPTTVVVNQRLQRVYVLNSGDGTVTTLDAMTARPLSTVYVGDLTLSNANVVAVDEQHGRVFIADVQANGAPRVSVLDGRSGAVLRAVDLSQNGCAQNDRPRALAVDQRTQRVFIACQRVVVLSAANGSLVATVAVGAVPNAIAVDESTGRVLVAHLDNVNSSGMPNGPGAVSALDATNGRVLATVPVGWGPRAVKVDAASRQVFVVNESTGGGAANGSVSVFSENALPPTTLQSTPGRTPRGGVVTVDGAGYAPGETISLTFAEIPSQIVRVHADATGALLARRVPVPRQLGPGTHLLEAVGATSGRSARATVTVLPPKKAPKRVTKKGHTSQH
jgi:DNA-binding beta-propeller fold protein YncE